MVTKLSTLQDCQDATTKAMVTKANELRKQYKDNTIILFQHEEHYRAFEDSARAVSKALNIETTKVSGITYVTLEREKDYSYFPKLVKQGFRIMII